MGILGTEDVNDRQTHLKEFGKWLNSIIFTNLAGFSRLM
jgi:hypothetical protein